MPNKSYIRGRKFEYDTQQGDEKNGATMAFRTAGSHGPFDVISFFPLSRTIVLTQCKTHLTDNETLKGTIAESERKEWGTCYRVVTRKLTKYIRRKK